MVDRQLTASISLRKNGELIVQPSVVESLKKQLCISTRTNTIEEAQARAQKLAVVRIDIPSTHIYQVVSAPRSILEHWIQSSQLPTDSCSNLGLDLIKGKYEGGFKVWESTKDLVKFVTEDTGIMNELMYDRSKFKCLEIGAGASIPSLSLLSRLISDPKFVSHYRIHLQDFNWEVLASLTLLNFAANYPTDYLEALIATKCLRLFCGDWKNFRIESNYRYNLIIMSEVLYNSDNYRSLHNLLDRLTKDDGYIVIATKDTYFGLSGSLHLWLQQLDDLRVFEVHQTIRISTTNIPRSLLILRRLKS